MFTSFFSPQSLRNQHLERYSISRKTYIRNLSLVGEINFRMIQKTNINYILFYEKYSQRVVGCLEQLECCFELMGICLSCNSRISHFSCILKICLFFCVSFWKIRFLSFLCENEICKALCIVRSHMKNSVNASFFNEELELVWRYLTSVASDFKKGGKLVIFSLSESEESLLWTV